MKNSKKRVLMIVFEFPPSNGASIQRITSVYNEFIEQGWDVDVITSTPSAYPNVTKDSEKNLPISPGGKIMRVFCLDALNQLGIKGKHIGALINPDRWGMTWIPFSLVAGMVHVLKYKPDIIWSSSPIPSTHKIASIIQKKIKCKWIADYRDPMPYMHRKISDKIDNIHRKIDESVMSGASSITFATLNIQNMYLTQYDGMTVPTYTIENGYDEQRLSAAKSIVAEKETSIFKNGAISLYYAGVLYDNGRDPIPILNALSTYLETHSGVSIDCVFQGAGDGAKFNEKLLESGLINVVRFIPGVSVDEALENMLQADVLILIQDEIFNNQVPGKVYEYLATGKTILLKTPISSATSDIAGGFAGVFTSSTEESILNNLYEIFREITLSKPSKLLWERIPFMKKHSRKQQSKNLLAIANNLVVSEDNNIMQGASTSEE
jgi:hypothetical protein